MTSVHELLSTESVTLAAKPLTGKLTLTTDKGAVVVAINEDTAFALLETLMDFLDPDADPRGLEIQCGS